MVVRGFLCWVSILILSFIISPSLHAEVVKWVDENGRTHYSDQPAGVKDYEPVDESDLITYSKRSTTKYKNKKSEGSRYRNRVPKPVQQPKQKRSEGSSSSSGSAKGASKSRY